MSQLEETLAFQFKAYKISPQREYCFYKGRRWRFDFAFIPEKLAVEVEGGIWSGGRHTRGSGFESDCDKYNRAVLEGWRVVRFTRKHVESGEAIQTVLEALRP